MTDIPQRVLARSEKTRALCRSDPAQSLLDSVIHELSDAWRRGEPLSAEEILDRHPELRQQPQAAIQVIYEEMILRREGGQEVSSVEVMRRFPQWQAELRALIDCDRLIAPLAAPTSYPTVGERLGDFHLLAELGRGAQGRVFLAVQESLADRPVVLKTTPCSGEEHLSLARLQHTHIVPLYWAQDILARNLRVLCMPYLGGASLAQALLELSKVPLAKRTGRDLQEALDRATPSTAIALPAEGPGRDLLARESYVRGVCWVGVCLANALHYAHERGLLHLDLKPGNVLLAADGQPMLLDLHLAREPLSAGEAAPEWLGGTPGYMSPEQQEALDAIRQSRPISAAVDGRSDVYALGVLLYEALGGQRPDLSRPSPVPLLRLNPQVSASLSDLVDKCLAREPGRRYAHGGALGADLQRHLDHQPLRGVKNRSLGERWRKWRRRAPHALPTFGLLLALVAALVVAAFLSATQIERQRQEVRMALQKGQKQLELRRYPEAIELLKNGKKLGEAHLFTDPALLGRFDKHLRLAQRASKAQELHGAADFARFYYGTGAFPPLALWLLELTCAKLWEDRAALLDHKGAPLERQIEDDIRKDLLDLALCWGDLRVRRSQAETARREALEMLDEAEKLLGPSPVIDLQRQGYAGEAAAGAVRACRTSGERLALGRALLKSGKLTEAAAELEQVLQVEQPAKALHVVWQDHDAFWAKFYLGLCASRLGQAEKAVLLLSECVGTMPWSAECLLHRGRALADLERVDEAVQDLERALKVRSPLGEAAQGVAELTLTQGAAPADKEYRLGLLSLARCDPASARARVEHALQHDPGHAGAQILRERLQGKP